MLAVTLFLLLWVAERLLVSWLWDPPNLVPTNTVSTLTGPSKLLRTIPRASGHFRNILVCHPVNFLQFPHSRLREVLFCCILTESGNMSLWWRFSSWELATRLSVVESFQVLAIGLHRFLI